AAANIQPFSVPQNFLSKKFCFLFPRMQMNFFRSLRSQDPRLRGANIRPFFLYGQNKTALFFNYFSPRWK
ncbi:hypothetical protein M8845_16600, partial [Gelidibacter japonicus]|uniref:hypothetical protein n=1 Tax=Gelidibacter japonicus TaxID=1962232 RepID=UPI0020209EAD